jgi:hypothetical protein
MSPHIHTGVISFLFAGVSAVVFIKLAKVGAGWMAGNASTEPLGRWLGGILD